ncbi:DUF4395 domain-containing protein [Micromonospora endophytica]|uniref:DUF4395 domain-containing protein n=1 Tax=Micromonospora endophytica TaxID=515350 RepID=A0A2W2CL21_9ACTN|nr:DUF4395 domain-containing protein [Micromonospora endophytica]PZG00182.1 DUF4395 domain-containing protein [Micromonospora endophytica]RIW47970.1 DUF4395 domain-containing protein [Micromonospora endophytica]BCJ62357.1 membrane protein [Micromonospora endophytica]
MLIDPRAPRFAAAITTGVLAVALLGGGTPLLIVQAVVFAITAANPRLGPYGLLYRLILAPRLTPPTELEPAAPVRFAQVVGLIFIGVALVGQFAGVPVLALAATGAALAAAFLNAAFDLCLGCLGYLALRRLLGRPLAARVPAGS